MDALRRTENTGVDFVEEFAVAAEWFADHLLTSSFRAPIPGCPGWNVRDLTVHLGNVHSWAATVVETSLPAEEMHDEPRGHRPGRLAEWYLAKAEDLYRVLRMVEPTRPTWNFAFGDGVAAFWQRRQTHETVLHGVDLAQAQGYAVRLPADLAGDGIDETLTVFLHRMHMRGHRADLTHPLTLRALDTGQTWTLHPVRPWNPTVIPVQPGSPEGAIPPAGPTVVAGTEVGADLVEGTAADLLLVLWKRLRPSPATLRQVGDEGRIARFLASRLTA